MSLRSASSRRALSAAVVLSVLVPGAAAARDWKLDAIQKNQATVEQEELRSLGGGIEYVWDQREYVPGTGQFLTAIHFRFRDGSELTNAVHAIAGRAAD